jgi:UDP-glucuronate decarboxylase
MIRLMESRDGFPGPVNIGNPVEFTIRELAEVGHRDDGSRSKLVPASAAVRRPTQRRPDISLAKRELDWEPQGRAARRLEKTIAYFGELAG